MQRGQFTGLIGSNGAGKTTLFRVDPRACSSHTETGRVLMGRHAPTSPIDRLCAPEGACSTRTSRCGPATWWPGYRRQPIRFRLLRSGPRIAVDEMLEAVDATSFADARVGSLSGGEQQRVLIAHALISRPRLLFLDEPLANLDIRSEQEVVELLARSRTARDRRPLSAHDMNPLLPVDGPSRLPGQRPRGQRHDRRGRPDRGPERALRAPRRRPPTGRSDHRRRRTHIRSGRHRARAGTPDAAELRGGRDFACWTIVFEPGFFQTRPVRTALVIGGIVAARLGIVGIFTVIRGQAFAGEALCDMGTLGAARAPTWSGSTRCSASSGSAVVAAGIMELFGVQRRRGRDVATGIVLGATLGLSALFFYLDTTHFDAPGRPSPFSSARSSWSAGPTVPAMVVLGLIGLARGRFLLPAAPAELPQRRPGGRPGCPGPDVGLAFLLLMGVSVSLSSVAVGTILVHCTADRAGRHRPAAHTPSLDGHGSWPAASASLPPGWASSSLRQLLLAPGQEGVAGELLRGHR